MNDQPFTLAELLASRTYEDGANGTPLEGVKTFRASTPTQPLPVVYEACIIIVGQGRKIGLLDGSSYVYDADNYLVLPVPLPLQSQVVEASTERPFLSFSISIDPAQLSDLILEVSDTGREAGRPPPRGISASPLTAELRDAAIRLLRCVDNDEERRIIAPSIIREIMYRVLTSPQGAALRLIAQSDSRFRQIARALRRIHQDYDTSINIDELCRAANMSSSAFHENFKAVTAISPLQYLKRIRLHKARSMILMEGLTASDAARRVGYISASQFSREYKRIFGAPPSLDAISTKSGAADPLAWAYRDG